MEHEDNNSELSEVSDVSESNLALAHNPQPAPCMQYPNNIQHHPNNQSPLAFPPQPTSPHHVLQHQPDQTSPAARYHQEYNDDDYNEGVLGLMEVDDEDDEDYAEGRESPTTTSRRRKSGKAAAGGGRSRGSKQKPVPGQEGGGQWDTSMYSPQQTKRPTRKEAAEQGSIAWPVATVKRIMKQDPEMMHISAEAAYAIAQAGEVFLAYLCEQALECARASGFKRNIGYKDFAMAVRKVDNLAFLEDTIPHTLTLQKAKEKKKELDDKIAAGKADAAQNGNAVAGATSSDATNGNKSSESIGDEVQQKEDESMMNLDEPAEEITA